MHGFMIINYVLEMHVGCGVAPMIYHADIVAGDRVSYAVYSCHEGFMFNTGTDTGAASLTSWCQATFTWSMEQEQCEGRYSVEQDDKQIRVN